MALTEEDELPFEQRFWRAQAVAGPINPADLFAEPDASDFKLIAENLPMLCWIARKDGYIVWYNKRWHDYCGSTPAGMEGWGWQSVHSPELLPSVVERWSSAIASGSPFEMTFPLRGRDGIFRPFLTRIVPVRSADGDIVRWIGVNTEISAHVQTQAALRESELKFATLTDAMPQMVWSTLPDGFHDYYNLQWYAFTGVPKGSTDGEAWNGMFHADDQERAWAAWRHSLATGEPYAIEYRLRHRSGAYRWALGRALPVRNEQGNIVRWIGTCTDIHEAKLMAMQSELMSHELSHRIKNIFAVVSGLVRLSARQTPAAAQFSLDLGERIESLGRAHEFARPHSQHSQPLDQQPTLLNLLSELLRPYRAENDNRVLLSGDDVAIDDAAATPIAFLIHELATNSAKYGALSVPEGAVKLSVKSGGDVSFTWEESGGPEIDGRPEKSGFGSRLTSLSVEQQLGGTLTREWPKSGLRVLVSIPAASLVRRAKSEPNQLSP